MRQEDAKHSAEFKKILQRPEIITWRTLLETKKTIFAILESHLQKLGFTMPRFQIMFYLYVEGPMQPSIIAEKLTVSRGNITTFLRRMRTDKLVKTVAGSSKARPKYALTTLGQREFEKIFPGHAERVIALVPAMEEFALTQLRQLHEHAKKTGKLMSEDP